jgi:D-3-phosphoglycerate dehydrogenase
MFRLLVMDDSVARNPEILAVLRRSLHVDCLPYTRTGLLAAIGDYDGFWGSFRMPVDVDTLARARRLKLVATASTGTDHLDRAALAERGIRLLCIREDIGLLDTFSATAELAWLLLLACSRHLRQGARQALAGCWNDPVPLGRQLRGLTLGVLGVGRLGRMTARYGDAFGMRVLGCDRQPFDAPGTTAVDFETLLRESDALSIHVHLDRENIGLIDASAFGRMRPGAILVNTSRAAVIDEDALLAALESGRLGAFGTDVIHGEWGPDASRNRLVQYAATHENVIITPHIGGATGHTVDAARHFLARKILHWVETGEELCAPRGKEP